MQALHVWILECLKYDLFYPTHAINILRGIASTPVGKTGGPLFEEHKHA